MSTATTGADQRARLVELGLSVTELAVLRDVDVMADAVAAAGLAPRTRFASAVGVVVDGARAVS
jgi:hypothetical protein